MTRYSFFADTYETERLKTLQVWSQFTDAELPFRPEPRSRSVREQMVHQCASEGFWMVNMLGIDVGLPNLPAAEARLDFIRHYAELSERRLRELRGKPDDWFEAEIRFFNVQRTRAWILLRRFTHSAHHRGQLSVSLRLLGKKVYSIYGPTADTGGLPANQAQVIYRYDTLDELLSAEAEGGRDRPLPGPGAKPPTERPS